MNTSTPRAVLDIVTKAMSEPLHLPLSEGEPIYEYDGWPPVPARDRWTITYGTAPGWSAADTHRVLKGKVKRARATDSKSLREYSPLGGSSLGRGKGASSVGGLLDAGEFDAVPYLRTRYVLILANRDGPVGYCAFVVYLQLLDGEDLVEFKVEVQEVFIEPAHRERGHSESFCAVIAQFATNALEEFNDRLFKGGARFAEGVTLTIAADVESRSGERFLFSISKELDRRADEYRFEAESPFELGFGLCIDGIEVDPRW